MISSISGLCRIGELKPSQFSRLIDCVETSRPTLSPQEKSPLLLFFLGRGGLYTG